MEQRSFFTIVQAAQKDGAVIDVNAEDLRIFYLNQNCAHVAELVRQLHLQKDGDNQPTCLSASGVDEFGKSVDIVSEHSRFVIGSLHKGGITPLQWFAYLRGEFPSLTQEQKNNFNHLCSFFAAGLDPARHEVIDGIDVKKH